MKIHRSPFPPVMIPRQTISACVFAGFAGREDAPVLIDGPSGRTLTGRQLIDTTARLAGGLAARDLGAGHVVAVMLPNMPEYAVVFHGAAWAGGTLTTVNPSCTVDELHFQLINSGAEAIFTVPAFLATVEAAIPGTRVREIVMVDAGTAERTMPFGALLGPPMTRHADVDLDRHVLVMPYSSGTTGFPKGVRLSHANLVANVCQMAAIEPITPGERTLGALPFFHIYGMTVLMSYMLAGGAAVVTLPRFDLEAALRLIEAHRMRRLYVVPPIVLALARHPLVASFDLSSVEVVFSGAAPLGPELEAACAARIGCEMMQGYGMTEMSPVSHFTPSGRHVPGSAGITVPNTECRIVDTATGEDRGTGEAGELWVRGPQVMLGYLNDPEATAATLEDGWLRTGDVGRLEADGHLFIVDRVKELIKVKGFQVAPAEVEAVLLAHPDVADCAVVGIADEECGEIPVAFVAAAPDARPELGLLQAFVADHLAAYKQIRRLVVVEAIPKSPSGKILRRLLREKAVAGEEPAPLAPLED